MSSKTFFGMPRKFCGMCGVVGIKDSPIIITYYFLFVNKRKSAGSRVVAPCKGHFADVMKVIFFLIKRMTMTVLW